MARHPGGRQLHRHVAAPGSSCHARGLIRVRLHPVLCIRAVSGVYPTAPQTQEGTTGGGRNGQCPAARETGRSLSQDQREPPFPCRPGEATWHTEDHARGASCAPGTNSDLCAQSGTSCPAQRDPRPPRHTAEGGAPLPGTVRSSSQSPQPRTAAVAEPTPAWQDLGAGDAEPAPQERYTARPPRQDPLLQLLPDLTCLPAPAQKAPPGHPGCRAPARPRGLPSAQDAGAHPSGEAAQDAEVARAYPVHAEAGPAGAAPAGSGSPGARPQGPGGDRGWPGGPRWPPGPGARGLGPLQRQRVLRPLRLPATADLHQGVTGLAAPPLRAILGRVCGLCPPGHLAPPRPARAARRLPLLLALRRAPSGTPAGPGPAAAPPRPDLAPASALPGAPAPRARPACPCARLPPGPRP